MKLDNFEKAQEYLYKFIPKSLSQTYSADWGLNRTKYLLELLDNPQEKIQVIHVAGTSGKGSTSYLISLLLSSLGKKCGLSISPHLIDIRERVQINNQLISKEGFVEYLNQLMPFVKQVKNSKYGEVTYFELLTVLAFYVFFKEKVEFAVMETGMGGLYDATNSVANKTKVAILTKIGLDHTKILGNTIAKIALQKAEIIQNQNTTFSAQQTKQASKVIEEITTKRKADLNYIEKGLNIKNISIGPQGSTFDFTFKNIVLKNIHLGMIGEHQIENCSLALSTTYYLSQREKFEFNKQVIKSSLKSANFPGRMEIKKINGKIVVLDGAHNPQKMSTFLQAVNKIYSNQKFNFLIAFKKGKDFNQMLAQIIPFANKIFIAGFFVENQDLIHLSQPPQDIVQALQKFGFTNYEVIDDNRKALKKALSQDQDLIITGSLYLLADIYPYVV